MQQDSLSVEDLTFGFSDLLNDNLEKNTQENRGKQKREEDLVDLFPNRDGFDIASCPRDAKNIDCESSKLPSKGYVSSKSAMRTVPSLANANGDKEPDESSGTRKENLDRTELKFSPQDSKFMRRISAGKTNKSTQYCVGKQEPDCGLQDSNSKGICPEQRVAGRDVTDSEKRHLWENTKRNKVVKTEPATRQLKTVQTQSELVPKKLLSVDQILTNPCSLRQERSVPQKIFSQPRRFSAPFSLRPLSPRCYNYRPISTQVELDRGDDKTYPDRSKLFSPTPPRKNSKDLPKPNLNELKYTSLTCEQMRSGQSLNDSKRSCDKPARRQNVLTALPISLCHKDFERARVECRLVQSPDRREARRRSYELATSSDFINSPEDTQTHHVSHATPPRASHHSNLLVPLLSGRRKSDSSVQHFTTFDSPIFDSDIDEKLTPLSLSPRATKKAHSLNLSIG